MPQSLRPRLWLPARTLLPSPPACQAASPAAPGPCDCRASPAAAAHLVQARCRNQCPPTTTSGNWGLKSPLPCSLGRRTLCGLPQQPRGTNPQLPHCPQCCLPSQPSGYCAGCASRGTQTKRHPEPRTDRQDQHTRAMLSHIPSSTPHSHPSLNTGLCADRKSSGQQSYKHVQGVGVAPLSVPLPPPSFPILSPAPLFPLLPP